jgi:hypothetical protein
MALNGYSNGIRAHRSKHELSSLKINQSQLMDSIHAGCKFGEAHRYGEYVDLLCSGLRMLMEFPLDTLQRRVWRA